MNNANRSSQHRGTDKLYPADNYVTCSLDGAVKLRADDHDVKADPPTSVVNAFGKFCMEHAERPAIVDLYNELNEDIYTYERYYKSVLHVAKAFVKLGLECHHGVGIIGFNSPHVFISFMAAIFAGGITAGIHFSNSADANRILADQAECNIIVVENDDQLQKILKFADSLTHLKAVIQYRNEPKVKNQKVYSWLEIMELNVDEFGEELDRRILNIAPNKCCSLVTTSGTTGKPKFVMLSHDNIIWTTKTLLKFINEEKPILPEVIVSYQPISHISTVLFDIFLTLFSGGGVIYITKPNPFQVSLVKTLKMVKPTFFFGVPKVWDFLKYQILKDSSSLEDKILSCSFNGNQSTSKELISQLGLDKCRFALTGGANCDKKLVEFFQKLGLPLLEAYGKSEGGHLSVNIKSSRKIGSVGKVVPGVQLKVIHNGEDGEIYVNGRNIFMGYLRDEKSTKVAFDQNNWLRTGDLGEFDEENFLMLTGRTSDFIILCDSRKVIPHPIESRLMEKLPCLSNCVLVGEGRDGISALLVFKSKFNEAEGEPLDDLDQKALDWCHGLGLDVLKLSDVIKCNDKRLSAAIQKAVDGANACVLSDKEIIKHWTILPKDFSVKGGELGSTMKLKRKEIANKYKKEINKMFI